MLVASGCGDASTPNGAGGAGGAGGGAGAGGAGGSAGTDPFIASLSHTFPSVFVDAGSEIAELCQSWTLHNDEPLYVNAVRQTNEGGWHHSNWTFGPEEQFDGPDGAWDCADRDYNLALAVVGGGVLFAQSTQAFEETQKFTDGAVMVIPPHSRITGNIHLLNVSAAPIDNAFNMELGLIPEDEVGVHLRPVGIFNTRIAADPQAESRFAMECDLGDLFKNTLGVDEMPDYNIYYVLGHYHGWGNYFNLNFVNEDGSQRSIVEFDSQPGDVLGVPIDPPMNSRGAVGMSLTCGFNNNTDRVLTWGIGDLEMCAMFAYIDADLAFQGLPGDGVPVPMGEDEEGRLLYDMSSCAGLFGIRFQD